LIPLYKWPSTGVKERLKSKAYIDVGIQANIEQIIEDVRENGDKALLRYTLIYDHCSLKKEDLRVNSAEIKAAYDQVEPELLLYLKQAKENITNFHLRQKREDWFCEDETGSYTGQIYRPLQRVGVYVPGGKASYPSSVLMTVVPAMVAGVPEIVIVTPPGKEGSIPAATLVAAKEAGVTEIYRCGGAQAIAALALGTATIPAVEKIVGPGNIFVALAKKIVYGEVGIDMLAGPSEILIIGDGSIKAEYAAADLLSQAEHDQRARAILVSDNLDWASEVIKCVDQQLMQLPRQEIARTALQEFGAVVITENLAEAFEVANFVAPEHLELLLEEPKSYLHQVKNAGAIFLGPYTPEPIGDYWAGPSHVIPTGGAARYASPLSVDDFYKRSSILSYSFLGMQSAATPVEYLASVEGLTAHGRALSIRKREEEAADE